MIPCIIADIDGTISNSKVRAEAYLSGDKNRERFYEESTNDEPIPRILQMITLYNDETDARIVFITGRPEKYRNQTMRWIEKHYDGVYTLYMRKDKDYRPDYVIKQEIYLFDIKYCRDVWFVLEDRTSCVKMWRSLGLTCLQVADGDY